MKEDKQAGHGTGSASKEDNARNAQRVPQTEEPLAEKDEVKQAEEEMRNKKPKQIKRKLRIL